MEAKAKTAMMRSRGDDPHNPEYEMTAASEVLPTQINYIDNLLIAESQAVPGGIEVGVYIKNPASIEIPDGYALGFRAHEYGSEYTISTTSDLAPAESRATGYGNGGRSEAYFWTELPNGNDPIKIATLNYKPDPNKVSHEIGDWRTLIENLGSSEYSLLAVGLSMVTSYSARDIKLSDQVQYQESATTGPTPEPTAEPEPVPEPDPDGTRGGLTEEGWTGSENSGIWSENRDAASEFNDADGFSLFIQKGVTVDTLVVTTS